MLAQKGAPVLGDVEAAMGSVAGEVDLDRCAGLVCAGAANAHPPGPAAAAVEVDCDAPARRFGHRFRRSAVAVGCGGEDRRRRRRQFGQGDARARRASDRQLNSMRSSPVVVTCASALQQPISVSQSSAHGASLIVTARLPPAPILRPRRPAAARSPNCRQASHSATGPSDWCRRTKWRKPKRRVR